MRFQLASLGPGISVRANAAMLALAPNATGTVTYHGSGLPYPVYPDETTPTADNTGAFVTNEWGQAQGWLELPSVNTTIDITVPPADPVTVLLGGYPGAQLNPQGAYNSGRSYSIADVVTWNGLPYISLVNANHNNTPDSSPADWQVLITLPSLAVPTSLVTSFSFLDRMDRIFDGQGDAGLWLRQVAQADSAPAVELVRHIRGETYEIARLREVGSAQAGGLQNTQLDERKLSVPMKSIAWNDGSVTADGAMSATASSYSYGGQFFFTATSGRGVHVTLPAGTTRVGIGTALKASGGLVRVGLSTDGGSTYDYTAANMLPTAQNLVDLGVAANTILAANGGPFQPADRVLDLEPAGWYNTPVGGTADVDNFHVLLADALDPTLTWTVKIVLTATKNLANPGTPTLYGERITYGQPSFTRSTAGAELLTYKRAWCTAKSAMEYALGVLPNGASGTFRDIGNFHGYERQDSLAYYIDEQPVTPPTFTPGSPPVAIYGRSATVVRKSTLFQPNLGGGSTPWATAVTVYRMTAKGLTVTPQITLLVTTQFGSWYPGMAPFEGRVLSVGSHNSDTSEATFNSGSGARTQQQTDGMVFWDPSGSKLALQMLVQDTRKTLLSFVTTNQYVGAQDNAPGSGSGAPNTKITKIYASRGQQGSPQTIAAGKVIALGPTLHRLALIAEPEIAFGWGN